MTFSVVPPVLLESAALSNAIRGFIGRMSSAYLATILKIPTFPPEIESWFRSKALNIQVGGEEFSQHRFALAFDMVGERPQIEQLVTEAKRVGLIAFVNESPLDNSGASAHFQALTAGTIPQSLFLVLEHVLGET